jgi:hypothetical protein
MTPSGAREGYRGYPRRLERKEPKWHGISPIGGWVLLRRSTSRRRGVSRLPAPHLSPSRPLRMHSSAAPSAMTDRAVLAARVSVPASHVRLAGPDGVSCSRGPASPGARRRSRALAGLRTPKTMLNEPQPTPGPGQRSIRTGPAAIAARRDARPASRGGPPARHASPPAVPGPHVARCAES